MNDRRRALIASYINQIPLSTGEGTDDIFNNTGYQKASRIKSDGSIATLETGTAPAFVTGLIPIEVGDTIIFNNCWIDKDGDPGVYGQNMGGLNIWGYFTDQKSINDSGNRGTWYSFYSGTYNYWYTNVRFDETNSDHVIGFTYNNSSNDTVMKYIRFTLGGNAEEAQIFIFKHLYESNNIFSLDRTYEALAIGDNISNNLNDAIAYTNVAYSDGSAYLNPNTYSLNSEKTEITITEPGIGGLCIGYPIRVSPNSMYNLRLNYSGPDKVRVYVKDSTSTKAYYMYAPDTSGASGTINAKLNIDNVDWIVLYLGANTGGTKTFSNVVITKDLI